MRGALRLLHADRGLDPEPVLAGLANEIRRCLACLVCDDDSDVHRLLGRKGKASNLHYVRKRAGGLGAAVFNALIKWGAKRAGVVPSIWGESPAGC